MGQRYRLFPGSVLHIGLCLQNQHQEVHWKNIQSIKPAHHHMGVLILSYRTWQNFSDICSNSAAFELIVSLYRTAITPLIELLEQCVMVFVGRSLYLQ